MPRIPHKRVALWLAQLSQSLKAGFNATESVIMAESLPPKLRTALRDRLESGMSWRDTLDEVAWFLTPSEQAIIAAAERSGTLPIAFEKIAESREQTAEIRRRLVLSMVYPAVLVHFGLALVPIPLLVEGQFEAYAINVGMLVAPVWAIGIMALVAFTLWPSLKRSVARRLPFLSGYAKYRDLSLLCRTLAVCMKAGMPIDACWRHASSAAQSRKVREVERLAQDQILRGERVWKGLVQSRWLPEPFKVVYKSGELSGDLDTTLDSAAENYGKDAKRKLLFAAVFYPKLMFIAVAFLAGWRVISFYKDYFDGILKMLEP